MPRRGLFSKISFIHLCTILYTFNTILRFLIVIFCDSIEFFFKEKHGGVGKYTEVIHEF